MVVKYKIRILPIAYKDLQEAKQWYNEQRENLGEEFKEEVNKEIDHISQYPEHYQRRYKELRHSLVKRFPYIIYYQIEKEKRRIIIFGILRASQNSQQISSRI